MEAELDRLDYRIDVRHGDRPYGFVDDALFGNAILESYRRVDELVGWLRRETEANLLLFSDHGFGPRIEEPPHVERLARAIASRVDVLSGVKRAYDSLFRTPVETEPDGVSISKTTGVHSDPTAWLASGPDVSPGGSTSIAFEDLTPTILALLDQPVPAAYVGTAVDAIPEPRIEDRSLAVHREASIDPDEVVSERLHNLGYADLVEDD